jgi:hypothetical protein
MKYIVTKDLSFLEWAKTINTQYPEILAHMRDSTDPLDRAISKRIMEIAEGSVPKTADSHRALDKNGKSYLKPKDRSR